MKRNKDGLKQHIKDQRTANQSEVTNLRNKLYKTEEAIRMVLNLIGQRKHLEFLTVEFTDKQVKMLKSAIEE